MGGLLKFLFRIPLVKPVLARISRPLFRILLGLIAVPIFRFLCRRILRFQDLDQELEKDLEQWFKASLVLLAATKNMEMALFGELLGAEDDLGNPWITGLRIMMAIGVIELMPDQALFALIHPGPPPLCYKKELGLFRCLQDHWYPFLKGLVCQHLNRSSPVFAILCTIFLGPAGWICYGLAITQYLIIGLVTSRDRAVDVLSQFEEQVSLQRKQLEHELNKQGETSSAASPAPVSTPEVSSLDSPAGGQPIPEGADQVTG
ncbi:MAG: DNA topoisomerase I [Planctomycetaceae bacterium]|nr:DNA topoisomerase I [Planctomycetaceae bacterium]